MDYVGRVCMCLCVPYSRGRKMMGPEILPKKTFCLTMHAKIPGHAARTNSRFRTCVVSLACVGARIRSVHLIKTRPQSQTRINHHGCWKEMVRFLMCIPGFQFKY
jgi:hypothetical protein